MDWQASLTRTAGDPLGSTQDGGWFVTADPLSKLTWVLPQQIADTLVNDIIQGTLLPGERLQEIAIAERFGVSRGPIREALRIVEKEGLIQMRPRYGSFVAKLSEAEVRDIFEVRGILLSLAARRIAETKSSAILAFLREGTRRLEMTVNDSKEFLPVIYRCSIYVTDQTENALARSILISLARRTLYLTRIAMLRLENRRLWAEGWYAMEQAIIKNHPVAAGTAMRNIVTTLCDSVLGVLADRQPETTKAGSHD
jgi:DNA-binding GntR family transcriptional regulator